MNNIKMIEAWYLVIIFSEAAHLCRDYAINQGVAVITINTEQF
jgi:hypothetical protein